MLFLFWKGGGREGIARSVESDQTAPIEKLIVWTMNILLHVTDKQSTLGLHCLLRHISPKAFFLGRVCL